MFGSRLFLSWVQVGAHLRQVGTCSNIAQRSKLTRAIRWVICIYYTYSCPQLRPGSPATTVWCYYHWVNPMYILCLERKRTINLIQAHCIVTNLDVSGFLFIILPYCTTPYTMTSSKQSERFITLAIFMRVQLFTICCWQKRDFREELEGLGVQPANPLYIITELALLRRTTRWCDVTYANVIPAP